MLTLVRNQYPAENKVDERTVLPVAIEVQSDPEVDALVVNLTPENPWIDRRDSVRKLGYMCCTEALPRLLEVLPTDPFWMVRCAIIQALEMIGDKNAIPILQEVAANDDFQVVRGYAVKAIKRLLS